jgi:signal transduction histidine kinase
MKIGAKERIATGTMLAAIGAIGLAVWWTYAEIQDARRERRDAAEIARALTDLRLVTFEYVFYHHERPRVQSMQISQRLDELLAAAAFAGTAEREILRRMRELRIQSRQILGELVAVPAADRGIVPDAGSDRRFEMQLIGRLLTLQQDNLSAAFRLGDLATARSNRAQGRLRAVIFLGLALIAAIALGVSWLIHRQVLTPVARLQGAARQVAAGNLAFEFGPGGSDEIGQLTQDVGRMTQSLRASLAKVERGNLELGVLNRELEAFSYSVAHDLRGPLRSMDGFSLALLEDYAGKLDDEGRDSLHRIRAASQRMGRLIDELLSLSRVTRAELRLQHVDLSGLAGEISSSLRADPPGRKVQWLIEEKLTIRADRELMRIAMQNLLDNAWKFTGKTAEAVIRVGVQARDGGQAFFVADNGVGFDMAYTDRLFGAFQRLHHASDFPGTGIGLAIVQRVIHRHGGRIWAEAKQGEGATFFFTVGEPGDDTHGQDDSAG